MLGRASFLGQGRFFGLRRAVAVAALAAPLVLSGAPRALAATNCPAALDVSQYLTPQTVDSPNWHFSYQISPDDGLVLKDVQLTSQLGGRYLAKEISLPFYDLKTSAFGEHRLELKPASDDKVGRSRVVAFNVSTSNPADMVLTATYAIDHIPAGSASCLEITQTYEFWGEGGGCEPSGQLSCLPFRPMVSYRFLGANGETLSSIHTFQRLWFSNEKQPNTAGVFQDCDTYKCGAQHPPNGCFAQKENPVKTEMIGSAIDNGQPGAYDNYHQTYKSKVSEPNCVLNQAGCPECVHIHWRWSKLAGTAWGDGEPIIPPGSKQSAAFAVVRYHKGEQEENPAKLVQNGEDVTGSNIVFYWMSWNHQQHDSFFYHQVFFAPKPPPLTLTPTNGCVGSTVYVNGTDFGANESSDEMSLTFDGEPVGTATTNSSGQLFGSFTVPATNGGTGPSMALAHQVVASGSDGELDKASADFAVWSCLKLDPTSAYAGDFVSANGTGFGSGEAVKILDWYDPPDTLATATTDSTGSFSSGFKVPGAICNSSYRVTANGQTSGDIGATFLYVKCSLP